MNVLVPHNRIVAARSQLVHEFEDKIPKMDEFDVNHFGLVVTNMRLAVLSTLSGPSVTEADRALVTLRMPYVIRLMLGMLSKRLGYTAPDKVAFRRAFNKSSFTLSTTGKSTDQCLVNMHTSLDNMMSPGFADTIAHSVGEHVVKTLRDPLIDMVARSAETVERLMRDCDQRIVKEKDARLARCEERLLQTQLHHKEELRSVSKRLLQTQLHHKEELRSASKRLEEKCVENLKLFVKVAVLEHELLRARRDGSTKRPSDEGRPDQRLKHQRVG